MKGRDGLQHAAATGCGLRHVRDGGRDSTQLRCTGLGRVGVGSTGRDNPAEAGTSKGAECFKGWLGWRQLGSTERTAWQEMRLWRLWAELPRKPGGL